MKNIALLATQAAQSARKTQSNAITPVGSKSGSEGNTGDLVKRSVDAVFDRFREYYSAAKRELQNAQVERNLKNEFIASMVEAGVGSIDQIKRGMMRASQDAAGGSKFIPSSSEFAAWCVQVQPEELGLPDYEDAFIEASKYRTAVFHHWTHPAVMWAAYEISPTDWSFQREWKNRKAFDKAYSALINRVAAGEHLPTAALENKPIHKKARPETAQAHLSELLSLVC